MTLAEKIILDRKTKGFSQEELAERAKISLRTIQRIEKGDTIPRGYTLQAIAEALGKPVEKFAAFALAPPVAVKESEAAAEAETMSQHETNTYLQLLNFSALAYLVFPYLNVILPIVLWRRRKHVPEIDEIGRKIINFQVLWTVALHVAILLMVLFQVIMSYYFDAKTGPGILAVFFLMYLLNAPVILVASSKLKKGDRNIYPYGLHLF